MYNKELLRIRELSDESDDIIENVKKIKRLLSHKNDFKYQESLEALIRIKDYCSTIWERRKSINLEIEKIRDSLAEICPHSIYINEYPYYCAICGKNMEQSNEAEYIISKFDKEKYGTNVEEIVLDSKDEDEAKGRLLKFFNSLQFSDNVKIRRKKL